jgi:hypothetical protein
MAMEEEHIAVKRELEKAHQKKFRYHDQGHYRMVFYDAFNNTVHKVYKNVMLEGGESLRKNSLQNSFHKEEAKAAKALDKKIPTAQLLRVHMGAPRLGGVAEFEYGGEPVAPTSLTELRSEAFRRIRAHAVDHIMRVVYAKERPMAIDSKINNWAWPDLKTYKFFVNRREGAAMAGRVTLEDRQPIFVDAHPGSTEYLSNAVEQKQTLPECYRQLIRSIHDIEVRKLGSASMDVTKETDWMAQERVNASRTVPKEDKMGLVLAIKSLLNELEK